MRAVKLIVLIFLILISLMITDLYERPSKKL